MGSLENWKQKIQDWLAELVDATPLPKIDSRVWCPHPECSRLMLYRDIWEHFFATHIFPEYPYQVDGKQEETDVNHSHREDLSVSDYVDNYELDRDQEEDREFEIQEATGGQGGRAQKLKVYYEVIQEKLEDGELVIEKTTHIGSTRGFDILRKFKQAVRRVPDDSLENYEIEGADNYGSYPVVIRAKY